LAKKANSLTWKRKVADYFDQECNPHPFITGGSQRKRSVNLTVLECAKCSIRRDTEQLPKSCIRITANPRRCEMQSYYELRSEIKAIQNQKGKTKKDEYANTPNEIKCFREKFGSTTLIRKGSWTEDRIYNN